MRERTKHLLAGSALIAAAGVLAFAAHWTIDRHEQVCGQYRPAGSIWPFALLFWFALVVSVVGCVSAALTDASPRVQRVYVLFGLAQGITAMFFAVWLYAAYNSNC